MEILEQQRRLLIERSLDGAAGLVIAAEKMGREGQPHRRARFGFFASNVFASL